MGQIYLTQGTQEWLDFRRDKIGASDAPIICGVSPYKTADELLIEKIRGTTAYVNDGMRRGSSLEPQIRDSVSELLETHYEPAVFQSDTLPWMIASLDGFCEGHAIEIKTGKDAEKIMEMQSVESIPKHYHYQMQHQLLVCNLSGITLVVSDGEICQVYTIYQDVDVQREILKKEKAFYERMISYDLPDDPHEERPELEGLLTNMNHIRETIQKLQLEYDACEKVVKECASENSVKCGEYKVTRYLKPGAIEYKEIPVLKDIDLNQYRKPDCICWRITWPKKL